MAADRARSTRGWAFVVTLLGVGVVALHFGPTTEAASESTVGSSAGDTTGSGPSGSWTSDDDIGLASTTGNDASVADISSNGNPSLVNITANPAVVTAALPTIGQDVNGATEAELRRAGEIRNHEQAMFYGEAAKIPSDNRVLPAGRDPLVESSSGSHAKGFSPDGHALELVTSDWAVVAGNSVAIHGTLRDRDGNLVPIASARVMLMDTAMTGYEEVIALGTDASGLASGSFTAPDALTVAKDPGIHKLVLEATDAQGHIYLSTSALQVSVASLSLTGRLREAAESGGLAIEAEILVTAPTRVHLAMTIAPTSALDGPRALAQRSVLVSPGVQWIAVHFAGVSLQALKNGGPYLVTAVQLHDVSTMPPARVPLFLPKFVTQAHSLAEFDEVPKPDKWLTTMARFLESP